MASWLHINESLHSHSHGMAAYRSLRLKRSFPRLKSLLQLRRFNHTLLEGELEAEFLAELGPKTMAASGHADTSKWKKMDSRRLGISLSMIPEASRIVVKVLQNEGYDAYLVGGCVRDILLSKTPKDFDVITTATLQEIKENFHRAFIVRGRFPICRIHINGFTVEVSNFETAARDAEEKEDVQLSTLPEGYDEKDIVRWRNSLKRDFTINSLFYDPFAHKIYDYSSGMTDLTFLKLRTLIPANLSFKKDCARILRGIRLAARLGLSFAEDTEKEIRNLYASVATLKKARLMMEMSSMLSYGSADASLVLLKRFNVLEVLLPFQAAYLACQSGARNPSMLMALFFNLDSVVSCDQPCNSGLWVSLLAFHLALVNYPQDALIIWTLCSVLYHGNWKEGVKTARELAGQSVNFVPEILESSNNLRDEELAEKVANFASVVLDSVDALTDSEGLLKAMGGYQSSPRSLSVFISKNAGRQVAHIFGVLMDDIESLEAERHYYSIDYKLLGKGDIEETRFVLGKVIMETMKDGVSYHQPKLALEKKQDQAPKLVAEQVEVERSTSMVSELETSKSTHSVERGSGEPDEPSQQGPKKQKKNEKTCNALQQKLVEKIGEILSMQNTAPKNQQRKQEMKYVEELLSLQKTLTHKYAKLETGKNGEAVAPMDLLSVLRRAPKMMNEHKAEQTPMVSNLEPAKSKRREKRGSGKRDNEQHQQRPKKQKQNKKTRSDSRKMLVTEKPGKAEAPGDRLSVLQKAPKMTKERISKPILMVSELEMPETKDSGEQASGEPGDELCRQKPKKPKQNKTLLSPLEQKLVKEKIGKILSTQKNEQQTNSVKDGEQLLSLLKKMTQKDDKLERGRHAATEAPKGILRALEKAPQMMKKPKSEGPKGMLNVLRHSNPFEREVIEKDAKPAKEQRAEEQSLKRIPILSRIFK